MSTMMAVALSILAGMVMWAIPRLTVSLPTWGLRGFWVVVVLLLVASARVPEPYNLAVMGVAAGMAIFENLYHRHRVRAAARKAAKASSRVETKVNPKPGK